MTAALSTPPCSLGVAVFLQRVGQCLLDGVAPTPSSTAIALLSATNGSANWYCISTRSRRVG